jgi:hypothetical protein
VQIVFSRVHRAPDGTVTLRTEAWRTDRCEYFYPASTVKLPVAVLALEWLHDRDQPELTAATPLETPDALAEAQRGLYGAGAAPGAAPPSIGLYVRHIGAVSNNFAFNRLLDLLGPAAVNGSLHARGYGAHACARDPLRIVHRVADAAGDRPEARAPFRFSAADGTVLLARPARTAGSDRFAPAPIPLGRGELLQGVVVPGPKDFAVKNSVPLRTLHDVLAAVVLPGTQPPAARFRLRPADRALLLDALTTPASRSGIAPPDTDAASAVDDGYGKYLVLGGHGAVPDGLEITNKVGRAYGFLTDVAYVREPATGVEFLLAATIHVNDNGIYNDGVYEYETVGLPFLGALGRRFLERERALRGGGTSGLSR